jgi:5-methyltetrahydrofolate--homocysteine methyltransferase
MSGLLVKSTLVMRDNLEEMARRGLGGTPVLLGGAALTRSFVEEDLSRLYPGRLYYGKDAFAGLAAMEEILSSKGGVAGGASTGRLGGERETARAGGKVPGRSPEVRADNRVPAAPFLGSRVSGPIGVGEVARYLDPASLFRHQWRFRPDHGESESSFRDRMRGILASQMELAEPLLAPGAVHGYFPVNADGDQVIVWETAERRREVLRFDFPRQGQMPFLCIADFFRPGSGPEVDYAAFQIVSMGSRLSEREAELFAAGDYHDYFLLHGLGVAMTEALAEHRHALVRAEWGFGGEDDPAVEGILRKRYRGARFAWGYPACPDLEDNETVAGLLDAARIGVAVGEDTGFQYHPEQTTSAIICHHPDAGYFTVRNEESGC